MEVPALARASAREALLFDVQDHSNSGDLALAERRVASWLYAPWLMLSGHLIIAASLLMQDRSQASWSALAAVYVPIALSMAVCSCSTGANGRWRRTMRSD